MQMAVIEAARNVAGIKGTSSTEFGQTSRAAVGLMTERVKGNQREQRAAGDNLGGTMRLGAYEALLTPGSKVCEIYGQTDISERHRHRYEVNIGYRGGHRGRGPEMPGPVARTGSCPRSSSATTTPGSSGVQFHLELKSRPFAPAPLFRSFIAAALHQSRLV